MNHNIRRFHSYEDVNPKVHYCVPRTYLIDHAYDNLVGYEAPHQDPSTGITVLPIIVTYGA